MTTRAALVFLLVAGCGDDSGQAGPPDAAEADAAPPDAPLPPDAPPADAPPAHAPDLVLLGDLMGPTVRFDTLNVSSDSCEVDEACVNGLGERTILRFDTVSANNGDEDLVVGTPDPASPVWQWSECHGHYHYLGYAVYELLSAEGVIASGHKQAFCLLDLFDPDPASGNARFDCGFQGISSGWADIYSADLPCQWIDVTDVPPGTYTLRVALNPEHNLYEKDYSNNLFELPVTIE